MASALEQVRELGIEMGSSYAPRFAAGRPEIADDHDRWVRTYIGWTTDPGKRAALEAIGVRLRPYRSTAERFSGLEVLVDVEVPAP